MAKVQDTFPQQFAFAKDLSGKYLFASENMAEATGFDSPSQMIGKRDADLFWKEWAEHYREGDGQAFKGNIFLNQMERARTIQDPNIIHQVCATKTALRDSQNQIIGVVGSLIDVTQHHILENKGSFDQAGKKFVLSDPSLSALTFSKKQITLLQYIIMGYSAADIGRVLNRSKRTIEGHIEHLKNKLQCTSKAEIIRWTVTSGLLHGIDWPKP